MLFLSTIADIKTHCTPVLSKDAICFEHLKNIFPRDCLKSKVCVCQSQSHSRTHQRRFHNLQREMILPVLLRPPSKRAWGNLSRKGSPNARKRNPSRQEKTSDRGAWAGQLGLSVVGAIRGLRVSGFCLRGRLGGEQKCSAAADKKWPSLIQRKALASPLGFTAYLQKHRLQSLLTQHADLEGQWLEGPGQECAKRAQLSVPAEPFFRVVSDGERERKR